MKQFFKIVFASMIGALLSLFVLIFLAIVIVGGMIASSGTKTETTVNEKSILRIELNYPIKERTPGSPFSNINFNTFEPDNNPGLNDIIASIKKAKTDPNILSLYLELSSVPSGLSTVEEVRNALIDFKQSKKPIIAYSEVYTQKAYYLASVADKIYLNPAGLVELRGFSTESMFFKGALAKLDIEPEIIRVGTFKSAVEPFMLDKMSDANRLQTSTFLNSLYDHFIAGIAEARSLSVDSVKDIANQLSMRNAKDAVKYKMVDELKYKDELLDELVKIAGVSTIKDLKFIELKKYRRVQDPGSSASKNKIAVIYASGEISGGDGNDEAIGSERISKAIRKARMDENVKAIVLRINSPGGSALASDVIWREVILAKKVKPVVASMGDVAASGGYYIACAADKIIAQPTTITGSIGVFGLLFNAENFFKNKLGITFDRVKTANYADMASGTHPLTESERAIIQTEVNAIYEDFTTKVAEGRNMQIDKVKSIAEGRVWSGADAKKIGLVDELGNINTAIEAASKLAGLSEYRVISLPEQEDPLAKLMKDFSAETRLYFLKQEYGDASKYIQQVDRIKKMNGIQARLPFDPIVD